MFADTAANLQKRFIVHFNLRATAEQQWMLSTGSKQAIQP